MRLFFAIALSEEIRYRLRDVLKDLKKSGVSASIVKYEQLHITLLFLGERTEPELKGIVESAKDLKMGGFPIKVENAGVFPNEEYIRVFWVGAHDGNGEIKMLHSKLSNALGIEPDEKFTGHVTLARIKSRRNINKLKEIKNALAGKLFGEFLVTEFLLMKSELTPQGAKYSAVERFKLG